MRCGKAPIVHKSVDIPRKAPIVHKSTAIVHIGSGYGCAHAGTMMDVMLVGESDPRRWSEFRAFAQE